MRGQVLETGAAGGQILGEDGQRYKFMGTDWKSAVAAASGGEVDFVAVGERATQVYPVRATGGWEAAARPVNGGDNSIFLGWLGIGCLVASFLVPVLPVLGGFIFGLMGAAKAKAHGNSTGLILSRVAWIGALVMTAMGLAFLVYLWPLLELLWLMLVGTGSS